jgi:hypothetical protein
MHPERAFSGRRSGPALVPRPVGWLPRTVGSTPDLSAASPAARLASPAARLASPAARLASPAARLASPAARLASPPCRLASPPLPARFPALPARFPALPAPSESTAPLRRASSPSGCSSTSSRLRRRGPRCLGRNYGALLRCVPHARLVASAEGHPGCDRGLAARSRTSRASNAVKPAQWGSSSEDFRRSAVVVLADLAGRPAGYPR